MGLSNIIFIVLLAVASFLFAKQVKRIINNINLGLDVDRSDRKSDRWKIMARVALGQSKMVTRPVAGILHIIVYVGFIIINIEVLEIVIDGIFGTHRIFEPAGSIYRVLIGVFEILAVLVFIACAIFLIRRNLMNIRRFGLAEMKGWPKSDANIILGIELLLMSAFLIMNAADGVLMSADDTELIKAGLGKYADTQMSSGDFWVSRYLVDMLPSDLSSLAVLERICWWFHITGIFFFLNYLPLSKHFHVILAFPNVFFSKLESKGKFTNLENVKKEVELMMDPSADPYATSPVDENAIPSKFGAKDVTDLTWKNLMDSYTCTECGRCSSSCPANITGKLLSPRKIMMDTRDRLEEIGALKAKNGADFEDGKSLLHDYIKEEELWACTSCNACVEECPINIDPLSIIIDLRRYLVMEESKVPTELTTMFTNVENNGAPWQFSPSDRLNWAKED